MKLSWNLLLNVQPPDFDRLDAELEWSTLATC